MILGAIFHFIRKICRHYIRKYDLSRFRKVGKDTYIGMNGIFSYKNIEIGNDVYIGANAVFQSSYGSIKIGNHVMFGPGVHIHCGNHKVREIGSLLKHTSHKEKGDDGTIVIEDDCWIGANTIILSNVTIGTGSIIGAGTIVTKDVPSYSICVGNSGMRIYPRFMDDQLVEHRKLIKELLEKNGEI